MVFISWQGFCYVTGDARTAGIEACRMKRGSASSGAIEGIRCAGLWRGALQKPSTALDLRRVRFSWGESTYTGEVT
jgi:hypothetical protein